MVAKHYTVRWRGIHQKRAFRMRQDRRKLTGRYLSTPFVGCDVVARALIVLKLRMRKPGALLNNAGAVFDFLRLAIGASQRERFYVLFVDSLLRVIEAIEMFVGSVDACPVFPREIAKKALELDARGVLLAHCHPSGNVEPSLEDKCMTWNVADGLALFGILVMDHVVIVGDKAFSFAQQRIPLYRPAPGPKPVSRTRKARKAKA